MRRRAILLLLLWGYLSAPTDAFALGPYVVTDLGTLGGTSSYGNALNDLGHVVGYSALPGGETRAFLWTPEVGMQNLGSIAGGDSQALDINNNETIVGVSGLTATRGTNRAFRCTPSTGMVLIDSDNAGQASGVNANDEVVGHRDLGFGTVVQTWSATNVISNPFIFLGGTRSYGNAINDLGQFVGVLQSEVSFPGFYGDGSGATGLFPNFTPTDLNNSREVVGSQSGIAMLVDFAPYTVTMLGKLAPSDTSSQALGINQAGTIVGVSGASGAFITDADHSLLSLTSLLTPAYSGWTILSADDINNVGQIVALGQFNGVQHAVLLTPVPEPSSVLLAAIACGGLWGLRGRFKKSNPLRCSPTARGVRS